MSTHACMWEGCTTAALPVPTSTGHYLCEYHLAQAYATVRAAQDALAKVNAIPVDRPVDAVEYDEEDAWNATWVIHHGLLVERSKLRRRPRGQWVPLVLLGIVFLFTTVFPTNDRWAYHIVMAFITFVLLPALLSMWFFGGGEGREVERFDDRVNGGGGGMPVMASNPAMDKFKADVETENKRIFEQYRNPRGYDG